MTRIALIQQQASADKRANVELGVRALETAAANGAELVCFPELAFEPFYPQRRRGGGFEHLAEPVPGPTTDTFAARARQLGVVVVLNLFERDGHALLRHHAGARRRRDPAREDAHGPYHRLHGLP